MAGLLGTETEMLRGLLGGNLDVNAFAQGLLAPQQRDPNEPWHQKLFGNGPNDPRHHSMMAFAQALSAGGRRGFSNAIHAANRAYGEFEDNRLRRAGDVLGFGKTLLDVQQKQQLQQRNRSIQEGLRREEQGGDYQSAPGAVTLYPDAPPTDSFGTGSLGGLPMFSMGVSPGRVTPPAYSPPAAGVPSGQQGSRSVNGVGQQSGKWNALGASGDGYLAQADRLMRTARVYQQHGDTETAIKLIAEAHKLRPEFSTEFRQVTDPRTGQLINVMVGKDGSVVPVPYGVKPDIHLQELGGHTEAIDRNAAASGQRWAKSPTFADRTADGQLQVSRGNLGLAQRRLALDEATPHYMTTDSGIVALPRRPQPGAPLVGQPVAGPDGQPLTVPLKPIPAHVNAAIVGNAQSLRQVQDALTLVRGGTLKDGTAGDAAATGFKGYAPQVALNRLDAGGVSTRAAIADLGSLKIHDRSGAAVSAQEFPRLQPFIPSATDDAPTVEKKLQGFYRVLAEEAQAMNEVYSREQGYRPNPVGQRAAGQQAQQLQAQPLALPQNPTATNLRVGQTYTLPNGKVGTWDGIKLKVQQ